MLLLNLMLVRLEFNGAVHFNTSYVVIKQALYEEVDINKKNFNTSYVVIKLLKD